uniref:Uncharacterized protein n=1 Tax=Daphnia magna TaxID=35525 RepID=A0A0P6CYW2_9CRUS
MGSRLSGVRETICGLSENILGMILASETGIAIVGSRIVLGRGTYGFSHPGQSASHFRDAAGNQVGSYAYINPDGKHVSVSYTADHRGFRVLSNDLPVAPVAPVVELKSPEPVQDTPEVAAAKAELFRLQKEASTATSASRKKRQVPFYPAALPYTVPYASAYYPTALPYTVPAPLVAKTTYKTVTAEADLTAKTPADTNKFDLKEKSYDVVTPLAYHTPYFYSYPYYPAAAPAAAPVAAESSRKKRQVPVLPYSTGFYHPGVQYVAPAPLVAKTTLKTVTAEADLTAKTPADTHKFDLKEKNIDVVTPVAYPTAYGYTYPRDYFFFNGVYGF